MTCLSESSCQYKIDCRLLAGSDGANIVASDINYLVMDYLITNGYPAAAKKFAVEANIQPKTDVDSVQERVDIRTAIHSGNIQAAIEKINELNPQVRIFSLASPLPMPHPPARAPPLLGLDQVSCTTHKPSSGV